MEREYMMTATVLAPSHADIADVHDQSPPWDQRPEAAAPYSIKLVMKVFVIIDITELARMIVVLLQVEVRWRGDDEVDRAVVNPIKLAGVTQTQCVRGARTVIGLDFGDRGRRSAASTWCRDCN